MIPMRKTNYSFCHQITYALIIVLQLAKFVQTRYIKFKVNTNICLYGTQYHAFRQYVIDAKKT